MFIKFAKLLTDGESTGESKKDEAVEDEQELTQGKRQLVTKVEEKEEKEET